MCVSREADSSLVMWLPCVCGMAVVYHPTFSGSRKLEQLKEGSMLPEIVSALCPLPQGLDMEGWREFFRGGDSSLRRPEGGAHCGCPSKDRKIYQVNTF